MYFDRNKVCWWGTQDGITVKDDFLRKTDRWVLTIQLSVLCIKSPFEVLLPCATYCKSRVKISYIVNIERVEWLQTSYGSPDGLRWVLYRNLIFMAYRSKFINSKFAHTFLNSLGSVGSQTFWYICVYLYTFDKLWHIYIMNHIKMERMNSVERFLSIWLSNMMQNENRKTLNLQMKTVLII